MLILKDSQIDGNQSFFNFFSLTTSSNSTNFAAYGIRELTQIEKQTYCSLNQGQRANLTQPPLENSIMNRNFTSNFYYRLYTSGCYYINKETATWTSYGVQVQPDTNKTHTHCVSSHLTDFASADIEGSIIDIPLNFDFDYVFAHASFLRNKTIYLTVIICTALYIVVSMLCIWLDKQDSCKTQMHLLEDNNSYDLYYYSMMIMTGNRQYSGTQSQVNLFKLKNIFYFDL